jgi:hypothetical protein
MLAPVHQWAHAFGGAVHDHTQLDRFQHQPEFSARDPADIQKVIHQPDHLSNLALDDSAGLLHDWVFRRHAT